VDDVVCPQERSRIYEGKPGVEWSPGAKPAFEIEGDKLD
jgi:hypothetical protein